MTGSDPQQNTPAPLLIHLRDRALRAWALLDADEAAYYYRLFESSQSTARLQTQVLLALAKANQWRTGRPYPSQTAEYWRDAEMRLRRVKRVSPVNQKAADRAALIWRMHLDGSKNPEIAEVVGTTPGSIKGELSRIRNKRLTTAD